ncbi:hypothetical protein CBR_g659 [Chara braunii]|uniref:Uncharacterized protein n=1 Tax=Chara braunii TaxID=69332 RepID=A0A388KBU1_CHABU|nr:hypothetical protein CBR_g659 [Chara braunii]|eukprot:GBG67528.1 hypothetical protein CBR_g659 [Chara braunii]
MLLLRHNPAKKITRLLQCPAIRAERGVADTCGCEWMGEGSICVAGRGENLLTSPGIRVVEPASSAREPVSASEPRNSSLETAALMLCELRTAQHRVNGHSSTEKKVLASAAFMAAASSGFPGRDRTQDLLKDNNNSFSCCSEEDGEHGLNGTAFSGLGGSPKTTTFSGLGGSPKTTTFSGSVGESPRTTTFCGLVGESPNVVENCATPHLSSLCSSPASATRRVVDSSINGSRSRSSVDINCPVFDLNSPSCSPRRGGSICGGGYGGGSCRSDDALVGGGGGGGGGEALDAVALAKEGGEGVVDGQALRPTSGERCAVIGGRGGGGGGGGGDGRTAGASSLDDLAVSRCRLFSLSLMGGGREVAGSSLSSGNGSEGHGGDSVCSLRTSSSLSSRCCYHCCRCGGRFTAAADGDGGVICEVRRNDYHHSIVDIISRLLMAELEVGRGYGKRNHGGSSSMCRSVVNSVDGESVSTGPISGGEGVRRSHACCCPSCWEAERPSSASLVGEAKSVDEQEDGIRLRSQLGRLNERLYDLQLEMGRLEVRMVGAATFLSPPPQSADCAESPPLPLYARSAQQQQPSPCVHVDGGAAVGGEQQLAVTASVGAAAIATAAGGNRAREAAKEKGEEGGAGKEEEEEEEGDRQYSPPTGVSAMAAGVRNRSASEDGLRSSPRSMCCCAPPPTNDRQQRGMMAVENGATMMREDHREHGVEEYGLRRHVINEQSRSQGSGSVMSSVPTKANGSRFVDNGADEDDNDEGGRRRMVEDDSNHGGEGPRRVVAATGTGGAAATQKGLVPQMIFEEGKSADGLQPIPPASAAGSLLLSLIRRESESRGNEAAVEGEEEASNGVQVPPHAADLPCPPPPPPVFSTNQWRWECDRLVAENRRLRAELSSRDAQAADSRAELQRAHTTISDLQSVLTEVDGEQILVGRRRSPPCAVSGIGIGTGDDDESTVDGLRRGLVERDAEIARLSAEQERREGELAEWRADRARLAMAVECIARLESDLAHKDREIACAMRCASSEATRSSSNPWPPAPHIFVDKGDPRSQQQQGQQLVTDVNSSSAAAASAEASMAAVGQGGEEGARCLSVVGGDGGGRAVKHREVQTAVASTDLMGAAVISGAEADTVVVLREEIAAKDEVIAQMKAEVARLEEMVCAYRADVAVKDKEVAACRADVAAKDRKISSLKAELGAKDRAISGYKNQLAMLRKEIAGWGVGYGQSIQLMDGYGRPWADIDSSSSGWIITDCLCEMEADANVGDSQRRRGCVRLSAFDGSCRWLTVDNSTDAYDRSWSGSMDAYDRSARWAGWSVIEGLVGALGALRTIICGHGIEIDSCPWRLSVAMGGIPLDIDEYL